MESAGDTLNLLENCVTGSEEKLMVLFDRPGFTVIWSDGAAGFPEKLHLFPVRFLALNPRRLSVYRGHAVHDDITVYISLSVSVFQNNVVILNDIGMPGVTMGARGGEASCPGNRRLHSHRVPLIMTQVHEDRRTGALIKIEQGKSRTDTHSLPTPTPISTYISIPPPYPRHPPIP